MIEFNYEVLSELRIHELRDLARSMGVKSPTSRKKEDIIEEVLLIFKGEHEPYFSKTKQGRPAKSQLQYGGLIDLFMPKTESDTNSFVNDGSKEFEKLNYYDFEFAVNSPTASFNEHLKLETLQKVKGYLEVKKTGFGILRVNGFVSDKDDVFVHMFMIKNFNLQSGDLIEGECGVIEAGKPRVLMNVNLVNKVSASTTKNTKSFDEYEYLVPTTIVTTNGSDTVPDAFKGKIKEGTRNFLVTKNTDAGFVNSFVKYFDQSYKVLLVNLNAMPEEKSYDADNVSVQALRFNLSEENEVSTTSLIVERAKRIVAQEERKVIVVINNFSKFVKSVNTLVPDSNIKEFKKEAKNKIKNFIMCAKNVSQNANLTLVLMDKLKVEKEFEEFFEYEFLRLFNYVAEVEQKYDGSITFNTL